MEKKCVPPQKSIINLQHLPPIDPATIAPTSPSQVKKEKPNPNYVPKWVKSNPKEKRLVKKFDDEGNTNADLLADTTISKVEDDSSICDIKCIDPNNLIKTKNKPDETRDDSDFCKKSGGQNKVSAKSQLHEACAANCWKTPLFECCNEEGPGHMRMFTFKVTIEIEEATPRFLECFGAPRVNKKTAAEHAAEGALWYLKQLGYLPIKKSKK